jgi:malonate transporter
MLQILAVTLPFFALVAAGYLAARRRVLPIDAIPGLNVFVLFFALPCMLYRFGARTPIAQLLDGPVALVWGLGALTMVGATVALTRRGRRNWNDASFGALVAAFPNTGFMGVPLLAALLGAGMLGPAIIAITLDMVLTSSLCIALSRLDGVGRRPVPGIARAADGDGEGDGRTDVATALRQVFRGVVVNPLPWSILLGGLASATGFALPEPIDRAIAMLAEAASPAALFTIGAVLARPAVLAARQGLAARRAPVGDVLPVVLLKLVAHPLLIWGLARLASAVGLAVSREAMVVMVLVAALPSASNVSMLAERFGADNGRIARIILWTTVGSFVTFALITRWLH